MEIDFIWLEVEYKKRQMAGARTGGL